MNERRKVGVIISGRGSNLAALIDATRADDYPATIVKVISNRPSAAGLKTAAAEGIPAVTVDDTQYETREEFEAQMTAELEAADVEIVCLAGFMRLLTDSFITRWRNNLINIHPSLLPAYPGVHTHERAIQDGVRISGATVHYVRSKMDAGPIIAQAAVPVLPEDTPEELAARVLKAEHVLYPFALSLVASVKV